jgi:uncharacterized protein
MTPFPLIAGCGFSILVFERLNFSSSQMTDPGSGQIMGKASRDFQIFVKPAGATCNMDCSYCYYLKKKGLYPEVKTHRMSGNVLEDYIVQHIDASPEPVIRFSWHGGEPTILGLDYFRNITDLQKKHCPPNRQIFNGMQTNGTLLDEDWCRFFSEENFSIGLSLDGPRKIHDLHRLTKGKTSTFDQTMHGYELLRKHAVSVDILCVVNADNVRLPAEVYRFFKRIEASYISLLPLVEPDFDAPNCVSSLTPPSEAWGNFLCTIFDEWIDKDIGKIKVQIFEEAARTAFNQEHSLCIFRPTCGDIPVVEFNGDFYSCDHFVDQAHRLGNILQTSLVDLIESPEQKAFGLAKQKTLPRYCLDCEVLEMCNGECPKNRFLQTPDGQEGLNYLCAGYRRFLNHCRPFVSQVATQWRQ